MLGPEGLRLLVSLSIQEVGFVLASLPLIVYNSDFFVFDGVGHRGRRFLVMVEHLSALSDLPIELNLTKDKNTYSTQQSASM